MGLWSWTISQMLSPKFFKSVKKEGFLRTYIRGHQAVRHSHDIGGRQDLVKCVGQDQFGNKYYEDFDVDSMDKGSKITQIVRNNRRWVEYSDYFLPIGIGGDRVPPGWHGWLSHVYDDTPPEGNFVKHHYLKQHTPMTSGTPLHHKPPGSLANPDRLDFMQVKEIRSMLSATFKSRRQNPWETPEAGAKTDGKKIIVEKKRLFEDPAQDL